MLLLRMLRVMSFDLSVYRDMRGDSVAAAQAVAAVVLAGLSAGLGLVLFNLTSGNEPLGQAFAQGFVIMPGLWLIQAGAAYLFANVAIEPGPKGGGRKDLLAAIGYSASPGVLFVLIALPGLGPFLSVLLVLFMVVTMVLAVKTAMDTSALRAVMAVGPGFLLRVLITLYG